MTRGVQYLCHPGDGEGHALLGLHVVTHGVQSHHLVIIITIITIIIIIIIVTSRDIFCTSVTSHQAQAQLPVTMFFPLEPKHPPANTWRL